MKFPLASATTARDVPAHRRHGLLAMAAIAVTFASAAAHAGCADPRTTYSASAQSRLAMPATADLAAFRGRPSSRKIVGTWFVSYLAGGNPAGQAYIQWHSDGTEWENINFPIEGGNICLGSWKQVGENRFFRNHYGWLYTAGILTGYFNETETAVVQDDAKYTGVTHMMIYDVNGTLLTQFSGTSAATLVEP